VMGTRDEAWTDVRCRGSGFLFWVMLTSESHGIVFPNHVKGFVRLAKHQGI
jgi:hypothetical protein